MNILRILVIAVISLFTINNIALGESALNKILSSGKLKAGTTGDFNPFSIREVRYALNFLVDRNLIVNELLGGYGSPMISNYGSFSADYLGIIDVLESSSTD